ncbi:hypothetical protein BDN71DRAFT_1433530 [Pleurotus eryngii]|uniref:Uncharacterized protein n=1 Tax=Pleurotus eryngii TaxID=5323 RepID=A0A9P5ZQD3_PLEER|nr:hypothetical protein BDN71DRAFT_1433530 [Pleurotus eryngii]
MYQDADLQDLRPGCVIQVISTHSALVQTILRYHSSDDHGLVQHKYEPRGWLTVEDGIAASAHDLEEDQVILMKPDMAPVAHTLIVNKTDNAEHSSDIGVSCLTFSPMSRVIGDEQTWIIRLEPVPYPPLLLMDLVPPSWLTLDCRYFPSGASFVCADPDAVYPADGKNHSNPESTYAEVATSDMEPDSDNGEVHM